MSGDEETVNERIEGTRQALFAAALARSLVAEAKAPEPQTVAEAREDLFETGADQWNLLKTIKHE